ncbi:MAG TPA: tRNA (adenosine(37)-N6)-dimethylallyltransferase MiaA [Candidatus Acidoferrum sp.]|nr:tRNA (adenosine(37)-N6)-dimethylallyltransferase MiaA [Candidatus Acidoferrum sp.]
MAVANPEIPTPLAIIVGPTASGKSALGVWLAGRLGGEVVSCDSTQVYRGFDIGTAKPTSAERRSVRHHLIDLLDANEVFTAGDYRRHAIGVLADLKERGKLPVLVVGTGLYLRALLEGLADAPLRSEELRTRLMTRADRRRPGYLHRLLKKMDPAAAARIAPQDSPKLIRAIEVCMLAGKPLTEVHRSGRQRLEGVRPLKIGLMPERNALYERIERRTAEMIDHGWRDEVRALVGKGIPAGAKPFSFIGYKELRANLEGHLELPKAIATIQQATRRYAKRQLTWFRKEKDVRWFEGFGDDAKIMQAVLQHLQEELGIAHKAAAPGTP